MPDGYCVAQGWIAQDVFFNNATKVEDFPVQNDMKNGRVWIRPGNEADILSPALLVDSLDGTRRGYGGMSFIWPFVNLSPGMVQYLWTFMFQSSYSNKVTVQTYNRATGEWEIYQAVARWPDVSQNAEPLAGGYSNFQVSFVNAVEAPLT